MKTALLFPGQGSQYIGMGQELFSQFEVARRTFEEASDVLGYSVSRLCFDGSKAELTRTDHAQPCILTVSIAAFRVLMEKLELDPAYCAGHSLGEISALTASGALSFSDAVRLVQLRGRLMRNAQSQEAGGMLAVHGISPPVIEEECCQPGFRGKVVISNLNAGGQTVISGRQKDLERMQERLVTLGGSIIPLQVDGAFHSPLMKEAAEQFHEELLRIDFHPLRYSVLSNVTARPYPNAACLPALLSEQMVERVNWQGTIRFLLEREMDSLIEVGPGAVLSNMLRREKAGACLIQATGREEDWQRLLRERARKTPAYTQFHAYLKAALCAKNYNVEDDVSHYMLKVTGPFRELEELVNGDQGLMDAESGNSIAYHALNQILEAKLTPALERASILNHIAEAGGTIRHVQDAH